MRIPLSEVPISARRLAAQHLASIHGTEMAGGAAGAFLADYAVPIYRPDIQAIAYYEFAVRSSGGGTRILHSRDYLLACRDAVTARTKVPIDTRGEVIGFVMVTNGRHDFPISHWSVDRQPPSVQAANGKAGCSCDGEDKRGEPVRIYRLDALSYVAEDAAGQLVGQTGQIPGLLSGLPHSLAKAAGQISSSESRGVDRAQTDENAEGARHELERSGPEESPNLTMDDKGGWPALKKRYADAFGPLLDHLRERAARTWELHDLIEKMGEGIEMGSVHRVGLLGPASIELAGPGRKLVRPDLDESGDGPPAFVISTERGRLQTELDLDVHIDYGNGERETLKFFLFSRDVPSNEKAQRSGDCENCEE